VAGGRGRVRALALAAALVAALVFARTAGFGFLVWDDDLHVAANPRLDPPTWDGLRAFWAAPFQHLYVPLSYTLFSAEAWLTDGPQPWVYHAGSVALHALDAALVVLLLARLRAPPAGALLGGLAFALHPLQVESVAWISEQRGLLSAALGLLALLVHAGGAPGLRRAAASSALVALALLAKPSAAALPLLGLALEVLVLRRGWRAAIAGLAPWFVLAGAMTALTKSLQADEAVREAVPLAQRPYVALDALEFYLRKLLWPAGLAPDYGRRPALVLAEFPDGTTLLTGALLVLAVALPAARRALLAPLALFVAALAPVLGLVPFGYQDLSTVADRYAYLALLGPALFVARAVPERPPRAALVAAGAALALLAGWSVRQSSHWRDTESIFARTLAVNRRSWVAHTNRGVALQNRGDLAGARAEYEAALSARPDHARARNNLGMLFVQQGALEEGLAALRQAARDDPAYARPHMNLAAALGGAGRLAEAEPAARRAVELAPEDPAVRATLGNVLLRASRPAEALPEFQAAAARKPRDVDAWLGTGLALEALGRRGEARAAFERALGLARARAPWRAAEVEGHLRRLGPG
jgi:Flp pilus assembly protein TadD